MKALIPTILIIIGLGIVGFFVFKDAQDTDDLTAPVDGGEEQTSEDQNNAADSQPANQTNTNNTMDDSNTPAMTMEEAQAAAVAAAEAAGPSRAVFTTSAGQFTLELYTEDMPITAGNFIRLAQEGFYEGIVFHRVIPGFMIQGGDPNTRGANQETIGIWGTGGSDRIPDEHITFDNYSNVTGSISMANSGPNSGSSQFFINVADNVNLDFDKEPLQSKHPVFGKIIDGLDVVVGISEVETIRGVLPNGRPIQDVPAEPIFIEKVEILPL